MPEAPDFLSVADACRNLCISNSYFYILVKRGDIMPVKLGRRTLVPRTEIERVVGAQLKIYDRLISTGRVPADHTKHTDTDI